MKSEQEIQEAIDALTIDTLENKDNPEANGYLDEELQSELHVLKWVLDQGEL